MSKILSTMQLYDTQCLFLLLTNHFVTFFFQTYGVLLATQNLLCLEWLVEGGQVYV